MSVARVGSTGAPINRRPFQQRLPCERALDFAGSGFLAVHHAQHLKGWTRAGSAADSVSRAIRQQDSVGAERSG
ncbi:MAG TPA: hypothetical protein VFW83_05140 [Bryobacteraceae bacterium]|nr:hypothetical protein [Bryobacteraceae bacterium]